MLMKTILLLLAIMVQLKSIKMKLKDKANDLATWEMQMAPKGGLPPEIIDDEDDGSVLLFV